MNNTFPAQPGSYVLVADLSDMDHGHDHLPHTKIPIIGWLHTQGHPLVPLTTQPNTPIQHGMAYMQHDEQYMVITIYDPLHRLRFDGSSAITDWLGFIEYHSEEDAPTWNMVKVGGLNVEFHGSRTFAKTSWWQFKDGEIDFIFVLNGGLPMPDDVRVKKITREGFAALKKTVEVKAVSALINPPEPEFEPELGTLDEEAEDLV
jgi:hypothetical protein